MTTPPPTPPDASMLATGLSMLLVLVIVFGPVLWLSWRSHRDRQRVAEDRRMFGPGPR